jgi:bleomycin hydrolase
MKTQTVSQSLTIPMLEEFKEHFFAEPRNRLAMNAITRGDLRELILNRDVLNSINFCFSHEVETAEVSDQARANTCWLFACLNWLRTITRKKSKVKSFEFSENYMMFYDKLEKANYFLENMIDLRDRDRDDRLVAHLLNDPNPDGGEWHYIANLIEKYGLVPKEAMPDTFNRENSKYVNEILGYKSREYALILRKMAKQGSSVDDLRAVKREQMQEIYRIMVIFFGVPPVKFSWSYRDDDKVYHQDLDITPQEFYARHVGLELDEMYTLVSCPADDTPFHRTVTVDYFTNMPDKRKLHYLNVPIEELKRIATEVLKDGEACLFGCEVRYQSNTKEGILDDSMLDLELAFNTKFSMSKAERIESLHVRCTHSMVFTGVDLVYGQPMKWKVENSCGEKVGKKGYFVMTDKWFDEYVFDIAVPKRYLSPELLHQFDQPAIALPPWHPLG